MYIVGLGWCYMASTQFVDIEHILRINLRYRIIKMIRYLWSMVMKWGWDFSKEDGSRGKNGNTLAEYPQSMKLRAEPERFSTHGMTFTIYAANGGHVVEFRSYDPSTDRSFSSMHVIPEGQEFSDTISKIVTLECLRGIRR
jgi:hypothetical protein